VTQETKQYHDKKAELKTPPQIDNPDDLQFEVSEAHEQKAEFVGGTKGFSSNTEESGVESHANNPQNQIPPARQETVSNDDRLEVSHDYGGAIEGFTSNASEAHPKYPEPIRLTASAPSIEPPRPNEPTRIRQLSEKELKQIEQNLYGSSPKLSPHDKGELLSKISAVSTGTANPAVKPAHSHSLHSTATGLHPTTTNDTTEQDQSTVTRRARGIAYFYKNWVQIVTSHPLYADDEIIMGDRAYILRPKKLSGTTKITLFGVLAGLAICWIAIAMVGGNSPGDGSIVGMVINLDGQPFLKGATIQIAESGMQTESNAMGMFRIDDVPKGSHKIELLVGGKVVGSDFATTTDNDLTMAVLKMAPPVTKRETAAKPTPSENISSAESSIPDNARQETSTSTAPAKQQGVSATSQNNTSPSFAKLVLKANVSDARFILDGKTIGAGNNMYSPIKPGDHKYQISRDGFKPSSGTIRLSAGETKTLAVELEPDRVAGKPSTSETQYFEDAGIKMQNGDYSGAIVDYTKAIEAKPSYADAFLMRGEAYRSVSDPKAAHDDFVKAAEIYRFRRDPANAQTSFAKALEVDSRSVTALLGRADLFLTQGQEIAALADYEQVIRVDKKNFEAHFGLGRCRFDQGNYKQAEKHFKDARDIDSKATTTYEYLMLCYQQLDRLKDLKKTWEQYKSLADPADVKRLKLDSRFAAAIRTVETLK
jgi:Tfp pilus assembly protein PilF